MPFRGLLPGHYATILADPPWQFVTRSDKGHGKAPQKHYACMTLEAIQALPVATLAAPDCALFMWTTSPFLPASLATLAAWGFTYKATGTWGKRTHTGEAWQFSTGYIMRSAAEFWLIGTRGRPVRRSASVRNLLVAPVREHSRKPDAFRTDVVEALYDGPYLELFAREAAPGWTSWGDQTRRFEPAPRG